MDRSHRGGAKQSPSRPPPAASRLTVKPRKNRRKRETGSLWSRLPRPAAIADACGRALRRSVPAAIGVAIVGAIGGAAWGGYRFVTTSSRFAITDVAIHGTHHLSADQIRATLPVHAGDNVFRTDLHAIVREVRTNPWIASAEARRVLPHTIAIEIHEHEPAAVVDLGGLYLSDAQGHVFKRAAIEADEGAGLPVITGLDRTAYLADPESTATSIRGALGALATWKADAARPAIGEVHLDPHGALTLHTYDQAVSIQLGSIDAQLASRIATFDAVWSELADSERATARAIHLDARPDHVTVAFKEP